MFPQKEAEKQESLTTLPQHKLADSLFLCLSNKTSLCYHDDKVKNLSYLCKEKNNTFLF